MTPFPPSSSRKGDEKILRRNWARLIQKIYEVDPLICPKCWGAIRIISSIEEPSVIRALLFMFKNGDAQLGHSTVLTSITKYSVSPKQVVGMPICCS